MALIQILSWYFEKLEQQSPTKSEVLSPDNNLLEFGVSLILWWVYVAVAKEVGGLVAAIQAVANDGAETAGGHGGKAGSQDG
jgi:hypothetical protein